MTNSKKTDPAPQTSTPPTPGTAFDRSICFTFFQPWLEAIRTTAQADPQKALDAFFILSDYCLYAKEPDPEHNPWGMAWPVISAEARRSINNRRRGFGAEDVVLTEAIRRYYMEHPGITQQATADALHCSIGKVNKVVRGIRSGDGIHSGSGTHSACDIHIHNDSGNKNGSNKVIQGSRTFPDSPPPDDSPTVPVVFSHGEGAAE